MKVIAFDVMGSDNGLTPAVNAGVKLLGERKDLKLIFVGNAAEIENELEMHKKVDPKRYEILHTSEVIVMSDGILEIRRKKDSSMVKAIELVAQKKADAIVTGSSTASFIAGCHFILKEIEGIDRPGFMPTIPTIKKNKNFVMLDVGANLECSANDLVSFAKMATIYYQHIYKVDRPKVALLNIGEEKSKGFQYHRDVYAILSEDKNINFVGNIEPRYITNGEVDVIVTDGYAGNVALKSHEGMAQNLLNVIKATLTKNIFRKLSALSLKRAFNEVRERFDYKNAAGAILLGVNGIAFKSHGSSDEQCFYATLRMTYDAIANDVLNLLVNALK